IRPGEASWVVDANRGPGIDQSSHYQGAEVRRRTGEKAGGPPCGLFTEEKSLMKRANENELSPTLAFYISHGLIGDVARVNLFEWGAYRFPSTPELAADLERQEEAFVETLTPEQKREWEETDIDELYEEVERGATVGEEAWRSGVGPMKTVIEEVVTLPL